MPLLIDSEALPFVPPTTHSEVAAHMGEPMQRIVAQLTGSTSTPEREPSERQFVSLHRSPMRSIRSLMQRPMLPLWQSLPAIERFLAPLGKDGRMSRRNWRSEIDRKHTTQSAEKEERDRTS